MKVMMRTWEERGMVNTPVIRITLHCQGPGILSSKEL